MKELDSCINYWKIVQDDYENLWKVYSEQSLIEYKAVKLEYNSYVASVEQELAENEKLNACKACSSSGQEIIIIAEPTIIIKIKKASEYLITLALSRQKYHNHIKLI